MRNEQMDEDEIDLVKLWGIIWDRRKFFGTIIAGCTIVAMVVSLLLPKEYTSQVTVQSNASGSVDLGGAAATVAALTGADKLTGGKATTYIELMKTRTVLDPIIAQVYDDKEPEDRPNAENFAEGNLNISNTTGTTLISVEAKGRTPEEANYIAENVVGNFLKLMTDLNKENKSLVLSFLDERIQVAKKEADDTAQALETYSKEHKIYGPDEQVKAQLEKSAAYDKTLGELEVQKMAQQAHLSSIGAQLGEQNADATTYALTDNDNVKRLNNAIVDKETQLVKLRTMYQEKHPAIVNAKTELESLQQQLNGEVEKVVANSAIAVSDNQAALQLARYQAATSLAAAQASENKVKELQSASDDEMAGMADDILEFQKLSREAGIKQEIYNNLTKQMEQSRIQQTMTSMDVQVVDPANMPEEDKPSGPKKKLITLIGMAIGCVITLIWGFVIYMREEN